MIIRAADEDCCMKLKTKYTLYVYQSVRITATKDGEIE